MRRVWAGFVEPSLENLTLGLSYDMLEVEAVTEVPCLFLGIIIFGLVAWTTISTSPSLRLRS